MKLYINFKPYAKMVFWTQKAVGEVSALGRAVSVDGGYLVKDVCLFRQKCSAGYTIFNDEAVAEFLTDLAMKMAPIEEYRFWFHSHANGGCFWSPVDEANILRYSQKQDYISLVMNKQLNYLARVDGPEGRLETQVIILPSGHNSLRGKCNNEVDRKVEILQPYGESECTDEIVGVGDERNGRIIVSEAIVEPARPGHFLS